MEVFSSVYNQVLATHCDYIYEHSIKIDALWEQKLCDLIVQHVEPGTDFLDIGANIGLVTLGVRKSVTGTIHCFECDNQTFNFLRYNTRLYDNIKLYNFGLSDKHNVGSMSTNSYNQGCNLFSSTLDETFKYAHSTSFSVCDKVFFSLAPLDFLQDTFTNKISVIKIDVEGFEYHVLKGARNVILQHRPVLLVEIFPVNIDKVFRLLEEYGYSGHHVQNEDYIFKWNTYSTCL
jgi:FkbM family methyltransferase